MSQECDQTVEQTLPPAANYFKNQKNVWLALSSHFELDLSPAIKITTQSIHAALPQSWIATGHHLTSQLCQCHLQKKKWSLARNTVLSLGFSHGYPLTHFAIWKPYSYFQSAEEMTMWPISASDSQGHFRSHGPQRNLYPSHYIHPSQLREMYILCKLKSSVLRPHVTLPAAYW